MVMRIVSPADSARREVMIAAVWSVACVAISLGVRSVWGEDKVEIRAACSSSTDRFLSWSICDD